MSITISGANTTSGVTIEAPTGETQFPEYFVDLININGLTETPGLISIAFSTEVSGFNLTSFGQAKSDPNGFDGTIWRLRNGENNPIEATLTAFGTNISNTYTLAPNTDTFVFSSVSGTPATHILSVDGRNIPKAASPNLFSDKDDDPIDGNAYEIIGGSGNDSLVGANLDDTLQGLDGNDTLRGRQGRDLLLGGDDRDRLFGHGGRDSLEGEAGNDRLFGGGGRDELNGGEGRDRLTGGAGADKFIFTNEGRDRVTDFSRSEGDIFQFDSGSYPNAPSSVTNPVVGFVSSTDPNVNIYVDTLANIENASGSVNFAYATDTNQLLYDEDGNWSSDSVVIADTNNFGTPTAANFDFI